MNSYHHSTTKEEKKHLLQDYKSYALKLFGPMHSNLVLDDEEDKDIIIGTE